jgi:23S rRNA (pseudouridine1915-N3)-methyltransferase
MHRLIIRAIGKPSDDWHPQSIHSYLTKLSPFAKLDLQELPEGHAGSSKPDLAKTQKAEAESLLKKLPEGAFVVALDSAGKNYSSEDFARQLDRWSEGGRTVIFLIGGSWGLDKTVLDRADVVLSFGRQTLPHLLARIVLLEQLYRAESILKGKQYHK